MNSLIKKVLMAVCVTLSVGALSYLGEMLFYPTPNVTGKWNFESTVQETAYLPYQGMILTFDAYLRQDDLSIRGNGEKIRENVDGREKSYTGADRVQIDIDGRIEKKFFGDDILHIHYREHGALRTSTTQQSLTYKDDVMEGTYVSSIADQAGVVTWVRE